MDAVLLSDFQESPEMLVEKLKLDAGGSRKHELHPGHRSRPESVKSMSLEREIGVRELVTMKRQNSRGITVIHE